MVMRNQTYDQYRIPDSCIHHNIYHPFDPMAYLMEPMVGQMYRELDPVTIPMFSSSRFNIHLNHRLRFRPFCRRTKDKSQALPSSHLNVAATIGTFLSRIGGQNKELNQVCNNVNDEHPYSRQSGENVAIANRESISELPARESSESYEGAINAPANMADGDSMDLATLNEEALNSPVLTYRMDYALQEKVRIDIVAHRYMITLKAHFSYWEHRDVAHHILKTLHQNLDERPSLFPETEK
ncbi:hypothetical protein K7432_014617 [Basidiobolus ranarum]|uniref:DDHD domain-containing protein n=1 Tax=Basidiobolus ranarum TaxID=34480 RepID=A0ABR2VP88_9FUNG